MSYNKVQINVHPRIDHEDPEGEYSSSLSLTSALEGVGGQRHAPAALPPRKTRYPLYRRLGGPQGLSGWARKISSPNGIRSPDRPTRSELLYRLSYLCPYNNNNNNNNTFSYPMMDVNLTSETSCIFFKDQRADNMQRKIRKIKIRSIISMLCCLCHVIWCYMFRLFLQSYR
jgi:hypothetical protein